MNQDGGDNDILIGGLLFSVLTASDLLSLAVQELLTAAHLLLKHVQQDDVLGGK